MDYKTIELAIEAKSKLLLGEVLPNSSTLTYMTNSLYLFRGPLKETKRR